jgi:hypothetical protein
VALLKKWLSVQSKATTCSLADLPLTTINSILTQHLLDPQHLSNKNLVNDVDRPRQAFVDQLIDQAFDTAQQVMCSHAKIALDEQTKLLTTETRPIHITNLGKVIDAIQTRQSNMIQRLEYDTQQKLRLLFNGTNDTNIPNELCTSIIS